MLHCEENTPLKPENPLYFNRLHDETRQRLHNHPVFCYQGLFFAEKLAALKRSESGWPKDRLR